MTMKIRFNIVDNVLNMPTLMAGRQVYEVGVPKSDASYDERCFTIRRLFGENFIAMSATKIEIHEDFRFFVLAWPLLKLPSTNFSISRVQLEDIPTHIAWNLLQRASFAETQTYRGAGADDGKAYVVLGCEDKSKVLKKGEAPVSYTQAHTWSPKFSKTLGGDVCLCIGSHTFTSDEEGLKVLRKRETLFGHEGDVMTTRPRTRSQRYFLGNVGGSRYTVPAFSVEDGDINQFRESKSYIVHEVLGVMNAHFGPVLQAKFREEEVDVFHPSDSDMRTFFERRMAVLNNTVDTVLIYDAVKSSVSRRILAELLKAAAELMPHATFKETKVMKRANIVLVPDPKRFLPAKNKKPAGDLFGTPDPYEKKPLHAQAIIADEKFSIGRYIENKDLKESLRQNGIRQILDTVFNEILIKHEVHTGHLVSGPGMPDFVALAPTSLFGKKLDKGGFVRVEHKDGALSFSHLRTPDEQIAAGVIFDALQVSIDGEVVEVKTDSLVHPLPDVDGIMKAFEAMPDGGNANEPIITPEMHAEVMNRAFGSAKNNDPDEIHYIRTVVTQKVSRKSYKRMFPVRKDATASEEGDFRSTNSELNKKILKSLEELHFKLRADGLKGKDVTQALSGVLIDVNRTFYVAGDASPIKSKMVRFPSVVRVRTASGRPVPHAFFELVTGQQQRYMRLSSQPFFMKHLREFLVHLARAS